jgi:HAE1 family hydrophobic/amphiphilic exporter-1
LKSLHFLIAFTALPLAAQQATQQQLQVPRVGVSITEKKLTLAEAIEMGLKNNLDIEIQRTNRDKAQAAIKGALGAFDPTFRFNPGYASNNTPTGSTLQGVNGKLSENTSTENAYYRQKMPWYGSSLGVDFENGRTSTSNLFTSLNPYFNSRLLVSFTLPLLRNRDIDLDRANILIRRKQSSLTDKDFEIQVIDIIARIQQGYWDLVAAREDVQVQADAVELASQQLAQNQRMIDSGTLAPIELSASQAELERRKDSYFASIGTVTEVENSLKTLLLPDRQSETWGDQLIPTDTRTKEPLETDDLKQVVFDSLKRRPEMKQVDLRKQSNEVDQKLNNDQTKPQVNFVSSYANAGLGGAVTSGSNPLSFQPLYDRINALSAPAGLAPLTAASFGSLPGSLIGGYGSTLSNLFGGGYQSVQVGIAVDFTARNRSAQSNYTGTLIEAKRLKYVEAQTEMAIESQVRNALQAIQTARQRISAAEASERAAKEKLESETRLFQTGESTNFLVLTRQNEYLDARRRAVLAHLDFNKAVARIEQASGTTLPNHNVTLR